MISNHGKTIVLPVRFGMHANLQLHLSDFIVAFGNRKALSFVLQRM